MKKLISVLLCLSLILSTFLPVMAVETTDGALASGEVEITEEEFRALLENADSAVEPTSDETSEFDTQETVPVAQAEAQSDAVLPEVSE